MIDFKLDNRCHEIDFYLFIYCCSIEFTFEMENEIDDDELAALLAEEDEQNNDNDNHPQETKQTNVSFAEQADSMTPEQLMQLTCSLIDVQPTTTTTTTTVKKDSTRYWRCIWWKKFDNCQQHTENNSSNNYTNGLHGSEYTYSYRFNELYAE